MRRVSLLMAVVFITFACSPDKGFGESREVEAEDYGSEWPLTVETAILNCPLTATCSSRSTAEPSV